MKKKVDSIYLNEISKTIDVLKQGGVILYPTDTIWGIGCDATNREAVNKIFEIKKRALSQNMLILIANDGMMNKHIQNVSEIAWDLIDIAEKPLTIIHPNAKNLAPELIAKDGSIGVRLVKSGFAHELVKRFNFPLVATSANISGTKTPSSFQEIAKEILQQMDYTVNLPVERNKKSKPSSIIKIGKNNEVQIIRN